MFIVSLLWLLMVSTPFVPNLLVENLETRYEVVFTETIKNSNKPVNILILGAGYSADSRFPATNKLSGNALIRLVEGIRIHNKIQGSYLITSGSKGKEDVSQAEILAEAAVLLGAKSSQIRMQKEPGNTWSEATECKRLFGDTAQLVIYSIQIGFRKIRRSYFYSQQSKKLSTMFFNEVVGNLPNAGRKEQV